MIFSPLAGDMRDLYAGSGLPHGLFLENYLFALKVDLRWVFVNESGVGPGMAKKSGFACHKSRSS